MEFRREPSLTVGLAPPLLRSNTLLGHYPKERDNEPNYRVAIAATVESTNSTRRFSAQNRSFGFAERNAT
jgi:hypothetical protein